MASESDNAKYGRLLNDVLAAVIKSRIPSEQLRCLIFIITKTIRFKKQSDNISYSQFSKATGLRRQHVYRAIKELEKKKIIFVTNRGYKRTHSYRINYKFDLYNPSFPSSFGSRNESAGLLSRWSPRLEERP